MKTVLVFGTFDVLHPGHDYFLRAAKTYGDRLVVIVARDHHVVRIKGIAPRDSEEVRRARVHKHPAVSEARLGYRDWAQHTRVLDDIQPDVICLGYDQHAQIPRGAWQIVRLAAFFPHKYKSSLMRKNLPKD